MSRLISYTVLFWAFLLFSATFLGKVSLDNVAQDRSTISAVELKQVDFESWKQTLSSIKAYLPEISEERVEAERRAEIERQRKLVEQKSVQLSDAILVGIVLMQPSKALLVLPEQREPIELRIGDTWLAPWSMYQISADYVAWKNTQTQELHKQFLFH